MSDTKGRTARVREVVEKQRGRHTPGPWRPDGPDPFGDYNILHPADCLAVAAVVSNMRAPREVAANAALVAAAPDLLDTIARLSEEVERLRVVVKEAAATFRQYERVHLDKGTIEGHAKAARNARMAAKLEDALLQSAGSSE